MWPWWHLRSVVPAVMLGIAVAAILSWVLYALVGWLGVGLLGLLGLLVSVRLDLHRGHAVWNFGHGSTGIRILAKQLEERSRASPEQKLAEAARDAKRSRVLYLINTACISMIALGFSMFALHQL